MFIDYSPRTAAGHIFSPIISSTNRGGFNPLFRPRVISGVGANNNFGENIDNKMDDMLDHLKQKITSNSSRITNTTDEGAAKLTIETDDQSPSSNDRITNNQSSPNIELSDNTKPQNDDATNAQNDNTINTKPYSPNEIFHNNTVNSKIINDITNGLPPNSVSLFIPRVKACSKVPF